MEIFTQSEEETINLGRDFAGRVSGGEALLLFGDLGAGKTVFTKGLALGLGIKDVVTSPTYVFLRSYRGQKFNLYHLDLYRLQSPLEVGRIGLDDLLADPWGLFVVEWPSLFPAQVVKGGYRFEFSQANGGGRLIQVQKF